MPHDGADRDLDRAVLEDPAYVAIWEAAYYRRSHRAFEAIRTLTAMLEPAEVEPARRRHVEAA